MPERLIRERMLAMAKGVYKPKESEPRVWYSSMTALSRVLCAENIDLLRMIDREQPATMTALAALSGRSLSNLSATLKKLKDKGFVSFEDGEGRAKKPVALFTDFEIVTDSEVEHAIEAIIQAAA
jgi:predicted transcriptional regulator